jgi:hypothetical protein
MERKTNWGSNAQNVFRAGRYTTPLYELGAEEELDALETFFFIFVFILPLTTEEELDALETFFLILVFILPTWLTRKLIPKC